MISPALRILTVSPMRISLSVIKSWLWSVAAVTVVPARWTGATIARGVSTPVRPTCTTISCSTVSLISGGYLKAAAQRGNFAVLPSRSRPARLLSFMTAPSISYGSS